MSTPTYASRDRSYAAMIEQHVQPTQEWTPDWLDGWPVPAECRPRAREAELAVLAVGRRQGAGDRLALGMMLGLVGAAAAAALLVAAASLVATEDPAVRAAAAPATVAGTAGGRASASIPMPRLVGLKVNEALERLAHAELRARVEFRATTAATGRIVAQRPGAGAAARSGRTVSVVIDAGGPRVRVPNVRGLSAEDAGRRLAAIGLRARRWLVAAGQPTGSVVDQAPKPAQTLSRDGVVTLAVAGSGSVVTVPNLVSMRVAEARAALASRGLDAHVVTGASAHPSGTVASQHPGPGEPVRAGSSVLIAVSGGNAEPAVATGPRVVIVPDMSGTRLRAAVQRSAELGLLVSIQYVPARERFGVVLAQSPGAGTRLPERVHVTLNASRGPVDADGRTVPDLAGRTLAEAVAAANGAGLRLIYLKRPVRNPISAGEIVEQTPRPGSTAPRNGLVLVYLGVRGLS
jgi:beta-lactam-binding protein with PASTA domain